MSKFGKVVGACTAGLVFASLLATPSSAQLTQDHIHAAGLGAQKQVIDVEGPSGDAACLGVVHLDGVYYVTGRAVDNIHKIYLFDNDGAYLGAFDQPAATSSSLWGFRDGATDGYSLIFGYEDGILVIDTAGNPVDTIMAANGPQSIVQPIVAAAGVTTHRALAYNPMGNGGDGSLWIGNFASDLVEIDLAGNVLTQFTNTSDWSLYGLVWDPFTGTLLGNSIPNAGDIAQIDPVTGVATGRGFPRNQPGTAQGGLSAVFDPTHPGGGSWEVVGLDQGVPDSITRYRVHLYTQPFRDGYSETRLWSAVDGGVLDDTPIKQIRPGQTLDFLNFKPDSHHLPKARTLVVMNWGADALVNGITAKKPEFVALTDKSNPTGTAMFYKVFTDQLISVPLPDGLLNGDYVRIQALSVNPMGLAAWTASNQLYYQYDDSTIQVAASGSNSFNSNETSGFFSVSHYGGPSIVAVEFDWLNSSNPDQATMEFDTDQTGMADVFDAGDSTNPDCQGTYRNGSDVATGLIYDDQNTAPRSSCAVAANANTGWIGTNEVDGWTDSPGDFKTLNFRFAPGTFANTVFEFDSDTDGGQGITGADMEGMVVTITLDDGQILQGELIVDPDNTNRSFLKF